MLADTNYVCWVDQWWVFFPFAVIVLGLFGIGVLILFAYIACNRKAALTSRTFNARFRFLFIRFRDERIYWEVVVILRKLAISCAIIFFAGGRSEMLVILFSMLIIFIAFILQTHNYPFRRSFHNIMEYCVLLATEFLLFCALLFYVDEFPDAWNKPALGWLCILSIIGSTILIAFLMLVDFVSQWREDRAQQKKEMEALKNRSNTEDPLQKFKEKRRQATTVVELKEDKEKEDGQIVQGTDAPVAENQPEIIQESTGHVETLVDFGNNQPHKQVHHEEATVHHEEHHHQHEPQETSHHHVEDTPVEEEQPEQEEPTREDAPLVHEHEEETQQEESHHEEPHHDETHDETHHEQPHHEESHHEEHSESIHVVDEDQPRDFKVEEVSEE